MESHWDKLPTLRVVDAGYLLAGMEPERKWQFAPPLVANFFNLIRDKTGAVKLATMPGERMEITQAEFQALKAEYGMTPATEPKAATPSPAPAPFVELEAQRGYVLALPSGQTHVQFGELAHLIADALWPEAGADDTRMSYGLSRASLNGELVQAVKAGTLQVKDPLTFGPHTFPVGNALLSALVTVDDLREFVATRGLTVEIAQTQATTPNPAPVEAVGASELPEHRRARWLSMLEVEEKRGRRGALQRVADREGVDRSNMRKDIEKARAIRTEQNRAGLFVSQLVQDGKRNG